MRLLFLSLEFSAGTFSGNGVLAQGQVRSLAALGHEVLVICGTPPEFAGPVSREGAVDVIQVELPRWGSLDLGCAWREYAAGARAPAAAAAVAAFRPHAVLGVDFHSAPAAEGLAAALGWAPPPAPPAPPAPKQRTPKQHDTDPAPSPPAPPPFVFLNYRIHLRTAAPGAEADAVRALEAAALRRAAASVFLSRSDEDYVLQHFPEAAAHPVHVLLPPLRADMEALPLPEGISSGLAGEGTHASGGPDGSMGSASGTASGRSTAGGEHGGRRFLLCCVRLSPEKEPRRFVDLAAELSRRGALRALHLTPVVAGAGWEAPHGAALAARLAAEVPEAVARRDFLGPGQLAELYRATALNFHPPLYDAYGMTIVEAASQGAPSLVHRGGHVGATDLLRQAAGEIFCADLAAPIPALADAVEALLADPRRLRAAGAAAAARARSWNEKAAACRLVGIVADVLPAPAS